MLPLLPANFRFLFRDIFHMLWGAQ
ncbi:hypothetical protein M5689_018930 [Euphorbia peplus]|nr:hypothetical protein M5689_018930 [Euphorbia peplus]